MDIIERYLAAIRSELPADKADDIIAELRDDLLTRIEAREAAVDRSLDKDETEAVMREFGRPLVIAARYREHQYLIGPETYPFWLKTLKVVFTLGAVLIAVLIGVDLAFGSRNVVQALMQAAGTISSMGIAAFGIITMIFALIERHGGLKLKDDWKLEDLPTLEDLAKSSRGDAPIEIVAGTLFLLWWFSVIPFPPADWQQFAIVGAPIWSQLFWPIAAVLAARLVMSLLTLLPNRMRAMHALREFLAVVTTLAGLVIVYLLFQAGHWVDVTSGEMAAEQTTQLADSLNLSIRIALVVCAIVWSLGSIGWVARHLRRRNRRQAAV